MFVCRQYWFQEVNSVWRVKLRKTVSFEEQLLSRDKYLCIFVCKMEAILSLIFQILLQCTGEKPLKLYASIMTCSFSLPTLFCVPFNRPSCRAYTERQAQQTYKLHSRYLIKAIKLCTDLESVACIIHRIQIKLHVAIALSYKIMYRLRKCCLHNSQDSN